MRKRKYTLYFFYLHRYSVVTREISKCNNYQNEIDQKNVTKIDLKTIFDTAIYSKFKMLRTELTKKPKFVQSFSGFYLKIISNNIFVNEKVGIRTHKFKILIHKNKSKFTY